MDDKPIYIPNVNKVEYPFCRLNILVERFGYQFPSTPLCCVVFGMISYLVKNMDKNLYSISEMP